MGSFKWCMSCAGRQRRNKHSHPPAVPPPSPQRQTDSSDSLERVLACEASYWRNRGADVDTPPTRRRVLSPDYSQSSSGSSFHCQCPRNSQSIDDSFNELLCHSARPRGEQQRAGRVRHRRGEAGEGAARATLRPQEDQASRHDETFTTGILILFSFLFSDIGRIN